MACMGANEGELVAMKKLEAKFRIVTPMFLGDAAQRAVDIRPPSVKGALRFWWRALNWARMLHQAGNMEAEALRALHREEARLFGLAAGEGSGGQGVFLLAVRSNSLNVVDQPFRKMTAGQLYLLGMGLATFRNGNSCLRNALAGGEFDLALTFRPSASDADLASVRQALLAFGLLGSLGSRARHGLGSVAITSWSEAQPLPANEEQYRQAIAGLMPADLPSTLPPFSAFSRLMRIDLSDRATDPLDLLGTIGGQLQMYRSYGQNGKVAGKPAERNFAADHDLILGATQGQTPTRAPLRTVFGLPHNYFFSSSRAKADVNYTVGRDEQRRASPLLLHIHSLNDGQYVAVHLLLKAAFLPAGAMVTVKTQRSFNVSANVDWSVPEKFLNRFTERKVIYGQ